MIGILKRAMLSRYFLTIVMAFISTIAVLAPLSSAEAQNAADTTYHHYINKKVSTKIYPWRDGSRNIELYNLYGALTYTHEDLHTAFRDSCHLQFYSNGAVERIAYREHSAEGRLNVEIHFGSTNEPERLRHRMQPWIKYAPPIETHYYWHRTERRWQQPEVIRCQPVPEAFRREIPK